jgi:HAD superfamily hydrolase (TIGR01509 family)
MRAIAACAPSLAFGVTGRPTGRPTSVPRATAPRGVDDRVSADERTRDEIASMASPPPPLPRVSEPGGIHAFLFDMDGTLCDTDPIHHEVFADLLMAHGKNGGVRIDDAFFHEHIAGKTNEAIFEDLFPELDKEAHEKMWEQKEAKFRALAETKLSRLPGLTELLLWAKTNKVRVAAVTNAPRPNALLMLRALGLFDPPAFEHVVIGTECARAKPFPDPYLEGMRLLGAKDPSRCVAFEDSPTGMAAAVAAGLPAVGVTTSQSPDSLFNAGASLCVADFADDGLLEALA